METFFGISFINDPFSESSIKQPFVNVTSKNELYALQWPICNEFNETTILNRCYELWGQIDKHDFWTNTSNYVQCELSQSPGTFDLWKLQ